MGIRNYKWPWANMHGFNLDWVIETVTDLKNQVEGIVEEVENIFKDYVTKVDLTDNRKLAENGNFTGTWFNEQHSTMRGNIDSNRDQIMYLVGQFSDGQTGLVIDGGFFTETGIKKNYNGGLF